MARVFPASILYVMLRCVLPGRSQTGPQPVLLAPVAPCPLRTEHPASPARLERFRRFRQATPACRARPTASADHKLLRACLATLASSRTWISQLAFYLRPPRLDRDNVRFSALGMTPGGERLAMSGYCTSLAVGRSSAQCLRTKCHTYCTSVELEWDLDGGINAAPRLDRGGGCVQRSDRTLSLLYETVTPAAAAAPPAPLAPPPAAPVCPSTTAARPT